MVLKYPEAKWEPLGKQTESRMRSHDILCLHTMVGSLAGTSSMFHRDGYGGTESHFGVGANASEGAEQWQDLMFSADANLDGGHRVISFETADYGGVFGKWNTNDASKVPAWTDWQIDWIVDALTAMCRKDFHKNCPASWRCRQVGIPATLIPDTKPGRRGIGYHKQGVDPYRVSGGEKWSKARGKVCPGSRRITQLINIIIPRVQKRLAGGKEEVDPAPPKEVEFDMSDSQYKAIMTKLDKIDKDATNRYTDIANRVQAVLNEERARYGDYVGRFNAVLEDLAADPNNPVTPEDVAAFRGMATSVERIETALQQDEEKS